MRRNTTLLNNMQQLPLLRYAFIASAVLIVGLMSSCNWGESKENLAKTKIKFKDSVRHYFAIPQGKEQTAAFKFFNVGENPLSILEVQTSCGCAKADYPTRLIEPGGEGVIVIKFDSHKYLGYSEVFITVRANTDPVSFHTLIFDLNVVPDAHYIKDYEEVYKEREEKEGNGSVKEMVEGDETEAGYYIDSTEATTY